MVGRQGITALIVGLTILLTGLEAAPAATGERVIRVGSPWAAKTVDPHVEGFYPLRLGLTETLVGVDDELRLQPWLATSWDVSGDKRTWSFRLRPGVRFHDGSALTAQAVKGSLERTLRKGIGLKPVPIEAISARGAGTLEIRTKEPFAPLPAYMALGDTAPLSPQSWNERDELVAPIGTGPFRFDSWQVRDSITAVRFPNHWGHTKALIDRLVYKAVPNAVSRVTMLRGSELDIAQILPADAIKELAADRGLRIYTKPIARCRFIAFNLDRGPFADQRVRHAVNHAINREALVRYVLDGVGEPAAGLFPPLAFWADKGIRGYPYDPQRARSLLAEAGWTAPGGKGVLTKEGKPFAVTLLTYPERAELPPTAEVIQSQLKEVGIHVEVKVLQVDAAFDLRNSGEFDMYLVGRGLLFVPDPDDNLMQDYHSKGTFGRGWGAYRYRNPALDRLLEWGRQTFDPAARKKIYDEIQRILVKDAPVAYLSYYVNVDATRATVVNYLMHPIEHRFRLEQVDLR